MPAIRIDEAEWELLAGEPAELLKLYCALKRRMDFATGIAGRKTLLNEIVLREGFNVDPIPGRPKQKPITREQYRSAVRRLEKLGLLVTIGTMVFEFPHARKDGPSKTATTELQPELQPQLQPTGDRLQPSNSGCSSEPNTEQQPELQTGVGPSCNLLPESGKSNPTAHIARACATVRFAMADTWEPAPQSFTAVLFRNGLSGQSFHPDQLLEFRSYWIARPEKTQTQAQWEHQLAQHLKRHARNTQGGHAHETGGRITRSRTRNAHDILTDPRW